MIWTKIDSRGTPNGGSVAKYSAYGEEKKEDIMIKLNSLINDISSLTFYGLWFIF